MEVIQLVLGHEEVAIELELRDESLDFYVMFLLKTLHFLHQYGTPVLVSGKRVSLPTGPCTLCDVSRA